MKKIYDFTTKTKYELINKKLVIQKWNTKEAEEKWKECIKSRSQNEY